MRRRAALATAILGGALGLAFAPAAMAANTTETHDVLVVANNWEGTADVLDPRTFVRLTRINIIPDQAERMAEIFADPAKTGYFTGINLAIGEGHNQYVDDAFTSHDGRFLYVSRPSFADVIAIDIASRRIVWRTRVKGYRADHMAISPDGRRLLVSANTTTFVQAIDTATGRIVGEFESGTTPHENNYSEDGSRIFHASIGLVYTPLDDPSQDGTKGARYFQVVDAATLRVLKRINMREKLEQAGFPDMSGAVRPMALSPGERRVYFQVSFFHGFVEYDLVNDRVLRVAKLPVSGEAKRLRREEYVLDSAHHGIAINQEGTKLCVAGTMSNYGAIVSRASFANRIAARGDRPYWVTNSGDGRYCFISFAGDDRVAAISYATGREVASVPVGDHPQRMRMGTMRCANLGPRVDCTPPRVSRLRVVRTRRGRRLRARLSEAAEMRIVVSRARIGRRSAGKRCRAARRRVPAGRRCTRLVKVRTVERRARRGTNRLRFGGKLRSTGRYRLTVTATDRAGNSAAPRRVRFRIRR